MRARQAHESPLAVRYGCVAVSLVAAGISLVAVAALESAAPPRVQHSPRPAVARARPRPQPSPQPTPTPRPPDEEYDRLRLLSIDEIDRLHFLNPVYFGEASAEIRDVDRGVLEKNAAVLKRFDFLKVTLEAHCDGRGSTEYNMRLGERRLKTVLKRMIALGVPASRLRTVSFGKEVPLCSGVDDDCLTRSRRVHFAVTGKERD
jgi:peptidoglycan-associated lipoprotein